MFGLFKKKSELDKLQVEYQKLMGDFHKLSKTDRSAADAAYAKAEEIGKKMDDLKKS
ncbi:Lacal_2735 family protein [Nonlabens arenilitoris]|uniref:Lacal_2735 family protein n=1 Tax=Nonlabens arenilitoris TaxID=1217969 RepID=UPI000CF57FC5|nr:Lacal_2735 family protein [Nonlabens arenilitoris]